MTFTFSTEKNKLKNQIKQKTLIRTNDNNSIKNININTNTKTNYDNYIKWITSTSHAVARDTNAHNRLMDALTSLDFLIGTLLNTNM